MKKIIYYIPLIVIILITIGYSALENTLLVDNIEMTVRPNKNVRVTNISNPTLENNATASSYDYNINNINGQITLPYSNSSVTFNVTVTNIGDVDIGILNTSVTANGTSNVLEAVINQTDYVTGEKLCNTNNVCNGGISRSFRVTIKYKNNASVINGDINFIADFNFQNWYTITYSGFDNTSGLINGILAGDTKTITLNNTTGMPSDVTVVGATGIYTYQATTNPDTSTLILSGATANITITAVAGTIEVIENPDGSTTTTIENTVTNGDGTETTTITTINQDPNGNTTSSSSTTSTTGTSGGVTTTTSTTINYDENGDKTSSSSTTSTINTTTGAGTSTTINYDANNNPTTGSTATTDTSGNVNTQEVAYDQNGNSSVSGYTIDTSGNTNGTGEVLNNSNVDTGMIVFDGKGFEMDLVFKAKLGENLTNNIFGAIQKGVNGNNNKYAGFNMTVRSSTYVHVTGGKNSNMYQNTGSIGATLHSSQTGFRISSTYNTVTTYTIKFIYMPANYGTNTYNYPLVKVFFSPLSSGTGLTSPWECGKSNANTYVPTSLDNATFTLGGNGINGDTYNMINFEVISFSVKKI